MRTLLCLLVLAFSGVAIADDVSVTGKWSGSFDISHANGETENSTAILVLKQTGTEITGTVGPDVDKQLPIQKGKIEGAKITLEADNQGRTIKFALVLSGDHLTGEASMSEDDGGIGKAKLDVTRTK
jgi:hypothetical protein